VALRPVLPDARRGGPPAASSPGANALGAGEGNVRPAVAAADRVLRRRRGGLRLRWRFAQSAPVAGLLAGSAETGRGGGRGRGEQRAAQLLPRRARLDRLSRRRRAGTGE